MRSALTAFHQKIASFFRRHLKHQRAPLHLEWRMSVIGGQWKERVLATPEQSLWLDLLEQDVISAEVSFQEYGRVAAALAEFEGDALAQANSRAMHFAKSFVTAARRVWWVLETANVTAFPEAVAATIKLERKKRRSFFEAYIEPRNAVEHASSEVKAPEKHVLQDVVYLQPAKGTWHPVIARLDLRHSLLVLATGESAAITRSALNKIIDCHRAIIDSALQSLPARTNQLLLLLPLDTSGWNE